MSESQGTQTLHSLSGPRPLVPYLAELWQRRQFTMSLATGDLQKQYLETVLGNVWHVLNPALSMAVYYIVFGVILGTSRGLENFIGFLAVGIFTFSFSQRTVSSCASSIANNIGLIRSLQFPRAVLPLSAVIRELSSYLFAFVVLMAILVVTGEPPRVQWLLTPVVVLLLTMFSTGVGLLVARLTDSVRDISNVIPFVFRFVFYFSGVIFALPAFVTSDRIARLGIPLSGAEARHLFLLDPWFVYIELLRDTLMTSYSAEYPADAWLAGLLIAPVTLVVGLQYFRRGEGAYGRG